MCKYMDEKNGKKELTYPNYLHSHHILCLTIYKKQLPPDHCVYCQLIERVIYEERRRMTQDPFK